MTKEQQETIDNCFDSDCQIYSLACSICEETQKRVEQGEELEKALYKEFDEQILYYHQQWGILQFYCTPKDADYMRAEKDFFNDLLEILKEN